MLRTKRIYEPSHPDDGHRILIDRIWPRGVSKERANLALWARDLAPSTELRTWYHHDPEKWEEFRARYFRELDDDPSALEVLRPYLDSGETVTLVFASREERLNNATALCEYLEARAAKGPRGRSFQPPGPDGTGSPGRQ